MARRFACRSHLGAISPLVDADPPTGGWRLDRSSLGSVPMRTILSVAAVGAILGLSACGSDATSTAPTNPATTNAPAVTDAPTTDAPVATDPVVRDTQPTPETAVATGLDQATLSEWIGADMTANTTSPGQMMAVLGPDTDLAAAAGAYDFGGQPLAADASFRIASVTKTFTSAAIYRLVEMGELSLDDTLVSAGTLTEILDLLRGDGYSVEEITIAQVLNHSSGLYDYAFGEGSTFSAVVTESPARVWTREDQIVFAMDNGDPVGKPGETSAYSDTGYIILGSIIETKTGLDLGAAYALLLRFDELGMTHTYLETPGTTPRTQRVIQRLSDTDVTTIDASIDLYGGGGLVSTTHDLAVFFRALWAGGVFDNATTWTAMGSVSGPEPETAQGIFTADIGGVACWYHDGFWGVEVFTCPEADVTIARSWNQVSPDPSWDRNALSLKVLAAFGLALDS
jgi:D-alanyl-D-alanine carboxypeptidase